MPHAGTLFIAVHATRESAAGGPSSDSFSLFPGCSS
jgi:hypothetical protein